MLVLPALIIGIPILVAVHLWAVERAWYAGYAAAQATSAPAVAADAGCELFEA